MTITTHITNTDNVHYQTVVIPYSHYKYDDRSSVEKFIYHVSSGPIQNKGKLHIHLNDVMSISLSSMGDLRDFVEDEDDLGTNIFFHIRYGFIVIVQFSTATEAMENFKSVSAAFNARVASYQQESESE